MCDDWFERILQLSHIPNHKQIAFVYVIICYYTTVSVIGNPYSAVLARAKAMRFRTLEKNIANLSGIWPTVASAQS